MLRVVVLVSGSGSNFHDLLQRTQRGDVNAQIVAVGADKPCDGLGIARAAGIPTFIEPFAPPRDEWSDKIAARVLEFEPDLTVLSGFMRILSPRAVDVLGPNLINTHPAFLPEFPGAHAVRDALVAGATRTGASVIRVDAGVDSGPVLAQSRIEIEADDTEASLHERIKLVERDLLARVVQGFAETLTASTTKEQQ